MGAGTPPPVMSNNQFMPNQPPPHTSSPAPSAHSQHMPAQQQPPPHSASPLSAQHTGPSPHPPSAVDVNGQTSQARPPPTPQSQGHVQPPVLPPGAGGWTSQQQQQMAAAMNIFGQAAQAQGQGPNGSPAVRPPQPSQPNNIPTATPPNMGMGRPPSMSAMAGINPAEFPFDARLMPVLRHAADPRWQNDMRTKNPALLQAVNAAQGMINGGHVRPETLNKMHQFYLATNSMMQPRPPPGPGGYPPQGQTPGQQQQFMPGGQGGAGPAAAGSSLAHDRRSSGEPSNVSGAARASQPVPESPAAGTGRNRDIKAGTPIAPNMPPPAWIPSQPTLTRDHPGPFPPMPHNIPVREWEGALRIDLPITAMTLLPEDTEEQDPTFAGKLPPMSEKEQKDVAGWLKADKQFAAGQQDRNKSLQKKVFKWALNNDIDTPWWAVRKGERYQPPRRQLQVIWPADKENLKRQRSHKGRRLIK